MHMRCTASARVAALATIGLLASAVQADTVALQPVGDYALTGSRTQKFVYTAPVGKTITDFEIYTASQAMYIEDASLTPGGWTSDDYIDTYAWGSSSPVFTWGPATNSVEFVAHFADSPAEGTSFYFDAFDGSGPYNADWNASSASWDITPGGLKPEPPSAVPLPANVWSGLVLLSGLGIVRTLRRRSNA